jgi:hypothetical protein
MQRAALVERYRSYAAKCIKISRNVSDPSGKLVLLEMAQTWLNFAEEAAQAGAQVATQEAETAQGTETPAGYETAVPATPQND